MSMQANIAARYPKGDSRRVLALGAALDRLGSASLQELVELTGFNKGSLPAYINQLQVQFGMTIEKTGSRYRIADWGRILQATGVRSLID